MHYKDYLDLKPLEFTRAVSFRIDWMKGNVFDDQEMRIEMVLQHKEDSHRFIRMVFYNVSQLRMEGVLDYGHGLGAVFVTDISDRQWLSSYEVIECEDEGFFFLCTDFDAVVELVETDS